MPEDALRRRGVQVQGPREACVEVYRGVHCLCLGLGAWSTTGGRGCVWELAVCVERGSVV